MTIAHDVAVESEMAHESLSTLTAAIQEGIDRAMAEEPLAILDKLRSQGWAVAAHNDYWLAGERHTFWLLTHRRGVWVKGEGPTDRKALAECREDAAIWERAGRLAREEPK